jgi:transcriptional regulator with XRE-family HTH domain
MTNISPAYLSQLESGMREGSVKMMKAIAVALDVSMDLLT